MSMSMSMSGSLRCRTCSARFFLPASSSSSFLALCPRCLEVYLHDSPTPDLVLPPPPPPILPPPPTTSTTEETVSSSDDLLPPPLPPWLVQGIPSQDPRSCRFMSSDSPPRPPPPQPPIPPVWVWPSSSSSRSTPWDHLLGPSDPVADTGKEGPPSNMSVRQVCREFRVLSTQEQEEQHRSSSTSTAETTPAFQDLLHDEYDFSSSDSDNQSPPRPPPPPPLYAYDPTFETLLQRGGSRPAPSPAFAYQAAMFEFDTPLQRSRSQAAFAYQVATFDTPLQRGGSPEAPPPVPAYDATFDTPVQRGGSQAAPAASIAALPTVIVADAALVCPICTDPLPISAPARRLPCDHLYHSECIVTWLSLRNSCPVCRASIPMFHSAATDLASPSTDPTRPAGRRRFLPGGRRIRRICSSLLRRVEISQDRQTNSSRVRQTDSSGDVRV